MNSPRVVKTFLAGIFLSAVLFSPFSLDLTLSTRYTVMALFLSVCCFLISPQKEHEKTSLPFPILVYFLYVIFSCVSIIWAINKAEAIFEATRQILTFSVFVFAWQAFSKNEELFTRTLLKISIIIVFIGLIPASVQLLFSDVADKLSMYNVSGLNSHKNLYSSFLAVNLFFIWKAFRDLSDKWKSAALWAGIFSLLMILLLRTKAVWGALIAGFLVFYILKMFSQWKDRKVLNFHTALLIWLIIGNGFFLFGFPFITTSILKLNNATQIDLSTPSVAEVDNERAVLWNKSYDMFYKYPLAGVGAGNWQIHLPEQGLSGLWRAEDLNFTFQRPHNDFLWILDEYGLAGFNFFLLFIFSVLVLSLRSLHHFNVDLISALTFIAVYFIISLFDFPKERMEHLIWISLLLAYCLFKSASENFPVLQLAAPSRKSYLFFGFLFLCIVLIGITRQRGEYYTREMYAAKLGNYPAGIIRSAKSAQTALYNLDPTSIPLPWYSGNAWVNLKDYDNAEKDFRKALDLNPFCRNVLNDLGSVLSVKGKNGEARKYYFEAARISPRFDDAKLNLCAQAIQEQNFVQADSLLLTLLHDSERRTKYQEIVDAMMGRTRDSIPK